MAEPSEYAPEVEAARWYIAGMFDGEGSVGYTLANTKARGLRESRNLRIGSTDPELAEAVCRGLDTLGIDHRYYPNQKTSAGKQWCVVQVHRKAAFVRFLEVVPFHHKRKRAALEAIVSEVTSSQK